MNNQIFKKGITIPDESRIIRRYSDHDVRLTPSDRTHDLIMQRAEEEYEKIKKEESAKKNLRKSRHKNQSQPSTFNYSYGRIRPRESLESSIVPPVIPPPPSDESLPMTQIKAPAPVEQPVRKSIDSNSVPEKKVSTKQVITTKKTPKKKTGLLTNIKKSKVAPKTSPQLTPSQKEYEQRPSIGIPGQTMDAQRRRVSLVEPRRMSTSSRSSRRSSSISSTTNIYTASVPAAESTINSIWIEEIEKRLGDEVISSSAEDVPKKRERTDRKETMIKDDLHRQLDNIKKQLEDQKVEEEYHPYAHRKYKRDLTNWQSISLLVRATLASGTLKMPMVFGFIGSYNGAFGIVLILIWVSCSLHILMQARHSICKILRRPYLSFGECFREAILIGPKVSRNFANCMGFTIEIFMVYHQVIVLTKYNNFIAMYASVAFDYVFKKIDSAIYVIPFMIVSVIFMFVKSIRHLAVLSLLANVFACIHYSMVLFQLTGTLTTSLVPNPQTKINFPNMYFIGQALTITDCIAAVIVIEEHMKHPKVITGYAGVINLSLMFSGLWYIMVGFFGIYQFGTTIDFRYLRDLEFSQSTSIFLYVIYSLAMVIAFCVQSYLAIEIIWTASTKTTIIESDFLGGWHLLIRTSYAVLPFLLLYLPGLVKHITMFIGYILGPFLMLGCPAFVHFCVSWHTRHLMKSKLFIVADIFLIILFIVGTLAVGMFYDYAFKFNYSSGEFL